MRVYSSRGVAALWRGIHVVLLVVVGVLIAVFLETVGSAIASALEIDYAPSLALTILGLLVLAGGAGWWVAPQSVEDLPVGDGEVVSRITGFFSTTFGLFTDLIVLLFVGLFLASQPQLYRYGMLKLFPPDTRKRGREVMDHLHNGLQRWLIGQFVSMAIVGTLTTLGLWALGIPLALGILAAVFEFIPTWGRCSQLLAGVLLGALGFVLATPLLVIGTGLVDKLYLEEQPEGGGETA